MSSGRRARAAAALGLAAGACAAVILANVQLREEPARGASFVATLSPRPARADAPDDKVVARVGESTITAAELDKRLRETPRSELAQLGSTPEEIRKNFLDRVLVRDLILAEEAKARGLDKMRDVRDRTLGALRAMLVHELRKDAKANDITDEDVKAYFEANKSKFTAPKRVGIYRILVQTEAEAKAILAELGDKPPDPKRWNDLARDKSLDKSNHLRGGNLGFVAEDGTTGQAENRVDPAIYEAAIKVTDGTVVPQPVKEGDRWAVVWKRQSMSPVSRSLEIEAPTIRAQLADERMRSAVQALLDKIRPELVKELNIELCDMVTVTANGELERAKRPGALPRTKRPANPNPTDGPAGLR
jgi:peptidyl-prolyl cis-trans isomerase C